MTKNTFGRRPCGLVLIPVLLTLTLVTGCDGDDAEEDTAAATETGGSDDDADQAEESGDTGSDDTGGDDTGGDDTGGDDIEIAGTWLETYEPMGMVTHTISDTEWVIDDAEFGPTSYALASYDNATRAAIGDSGDGFSKLQWTWTDDDTRLWYCTAVFGAMTADEAEAGPDADATDPANGGCGGFAWSALIAAE